MHHRLTKVNPQNPDSTIRASPLIPDLTIWLQKHTENVLAVLMMWITMVFYSCSKPHRRSLVGIFKYSLHQTCWVKNLPNRCCRAKPRESEPAACTGQQGRLAKPHLVHQRWSKAHTSFGENCAHACKVSSKTLKSVCCLKTYKNLSVIQGSRQVAEASRGFTITMSPAIQQLTTWKALATGNQHLPFSSVCIPAPNENLQLKINYSCCSAQSSSLSARGTLPSG